MSAGDAPGRAGESSVSVGYPSAIAPGLPAFTLDVPSGWHVGEFPDALLGIAAPKVDGRLRPNIVVQGRRVADDLPLIKAANEAVAELQRVHGGIVAGERKDNANGSAELVQQQLRYQLGGGDIAVAHLMVLVLVHDEIAPGAFRSLLGINAVCAVDDAGEYLPVFRSVLSSFNLERRGASPSKVVSE